MTLKCVQANNTVPIDLNTDETHWTPESCWEADTHTQKRAWTVPSRIIWMHKQPPKLVPSMHPVLYSLFPSHRPLVVLRLVWSHSCSFALSLSLSLGFGCAKAVPGAQNLVHTLCWPLRADASYLTPSTPLA